MHHSWELLKRFSCDSDLPWLIVEDFNEVLSQEDYFGIASRFECQIDAFRQVIEVCWLTEVNFRGPRFTLYRSKMDEIAPCVSLDKGFVNSSWASLFSDTTTDHLSISVSNHLPIQMAFGVLR